MTHQVFSQSSGGESSSSGDRDSGAGKSAKPLETANPVDLIRTHKLQNKNVERVKELIQNDGEIKETVKYVEHEGKRYIVDGNHRVRAARELGLDKVPVEEVKLPYRGYKTVDELLNK